jgi:hypothetical protein
MKRTCAWRRHVDGTIVEITESNGKFSAYISAVDSADDLHITKAISDLVNVEEVKNYIDNRIRNEYHDCATFGCPGWVNC